MPTPAYFSKYPPFPSNVPIADVPVLSYARLVAGNEYESNALFEASRGIGFFQLDFTESEFGEKFVKDTEHMFDLNEELYALPNEKLMECAYNPPKSLFGYKPLGYHKIGNTGDRNELYGISRDDIFNVSERLPNPSCIERERPQIKSYIEQANNIVLCILGCLERRLELPAGSFGNLLKMSDKSGSILRLLKYPPQPINDRRTAMMGHTDITALTLLFNMTGGLQILDGDADPKLESSWSYIRPRPSTCIVNLGDAMVEWTGGILRSAMHRVTSAPGAQAQSTRYVVGYFARPAGDALMGRLAEPEYRGSLVPRLGDAEEKGVLLNARDWEWFKLASVRKGDEGGSYGGSVEVGKRVGELERRVEREEMEREMERERMGEMDRNEKVLRGLEGLFQPVILGN